MPRPATPAFAAPEDHDFAGTALNIIPSGQYGSVPAPPGADKVEDLQQTADDLIQEAGECLSELKRGRAAMATSGARLLRQIEELDGGAGPAADDDGAYHFDDPESPLDEPPDSGRRFGLR